MKSLVLSVFFSLFSLCLFAQTNTIKGILVDTTGQVLGSATVSILQKRDSSLVNYTLSDSKGSFEIRDLPFGEYLIFISFTGYEVYKGTFSFSAINVYQILVLLCYGLSIKHCQELPLQKAL